MQRRAMLAALVSLWVFAPHSFAAERASDRYDLRYGLAVDAARYDQATPRATINSVIQAIGASEVEYLLAHLISPAEVDAKFADDPPALKELALGVTPEKSQQLVDALLRHLNDGRWTLRGTTARSQVAGLPDLTLERIDQRWFMHNVPTAGR